MPSNRSKGTRTKATKEVPTVQTNPTELPSFEPPAAPLNNERALATLREMQVGTMDSIVSDIDGLLALPNEGELGLVKAHGIMEVAKELKVQQQRIMALLARLIQEVESYSLWTLFPQDEYTSSRDFWENGVNLDYSYVTLALGFQTEVRPLLIQAGIDPNEYLENTTKEGLRAARTDARDIKRQLQDVPEEQYTEETREVIRETLGRYPGLPNTEIKAIREMQKGNTPALPIYAKVTITVANGKPSAHIEYDINLDEAIARQEHRAYIVMTVNGQRLDDTSLVTFMRNQASLARSTAPTPRVVDATINDLFDLEDEEDEFDLRRSA